MTLLEVLVSCAVGIAIPVGTLYYRAAKEWRDIHAAYPPSPGIRTRDNEGRPIYGYQPYRSYATMRHAETLALMQEIERDIEMTIPVVIAQNEDAWYPPDKKDRYLDSLITTRAYAEALAEEAQGALRGECEYVEYEELH